MLIPLMCTLMASTTLASPLARTDATLTGESATAGRKLLFTPEGTFKVLSMSDMHFGECNGDGSPAPWGPEHDAATQVAHRAILDAEKPDYVVFNGDLLTGENIKAGQHGQYLEQCFGPTAERSIPFSSTYGNHDNSETVNHEMILSYEKATYPALSYTRSDVGPAPYGHVNYWIPVYANASATKPDLVMWFLDSRGGIPSGPDRGVSWVDEGSVPAWIAAQGTAMEAKWGSIPSSVVFVHIPFKATRDMTGLPIDGNHDETAFGVQGYKDDAYTVKDVPALEAIAALGKKSSVLAINTGHVHGQSWCGRSSASQGLTMCFDGHSGHGGYVTPNSAVRNGRVFAFDLQTLRGENATVKTYNSFEDGSKKNQITLGADFMP